MSLPVSLETRAGVLRFPAYVPVTTFGGKYPLDDLVRPYLRRLSSAVMVSRFYAREMKERPGLPVLVDSGGFACLFERSRVEEEDGLGLIVTREAESEERLHPRDVLEFQESIADVAFTLDFPIPPGLDRAEAERRHRLTITNATWALRNRRRRDMPLYACIQGWDETSARSSARALAGEPFDGFAIGGLVPRLAAPALVESIVKGVREEIPDRPLHVFGVGNPETVERLFSWGVQSVDSSSYVKLAAEGRLWSDSRFRCEEASPAERLQLALLNLAAATQATLPLSASHILFRSTLIASGGANPRKRW